MPTFDSDEVTTKVNATRDAIGDNTNNSQVSKASQALLDELEKEIKDIWETKDGRARKSITNAQKKRIAEIYERLDNIKTANDGEAANPGFLTSLYRGVRDQINESTRPMSLARNAALLVGCYAIGTLIMGAALVSFPLSLGAMAAGAVVFGIFKLGSMLARWVWDKCKTHEERIEARKAAAAAKEGLNSDPEKTKADGKLKATETAIDISINGKGVSDASKKLFTELKEQLNKILVKPEKERTSADKKQIAAIYERLDNIKTANDGEAANPGFLTSLYRGVRDQINESTRPMSLARNAALLVGCYAIGTLIMGAALVSFPLSLGAMAAGAVVFGIFKLGSMIARGVLDSCKTPEERVNARMDAAVAKAGIPMSQTGATPSGSAPVVQTNSSSSQINSHRSTTFTLGRQ